MAKAKSITFVEYKGIDKLLSTLTEEKILKKKNIEKFFKKDLLFWTDLEFSEFNHVMQYIEYKISGSFDKYLENKKQPCCYVNEMARPCTFRRVMQVYFPYKQKNRTLTFIQLHMCGQNKKDSIIIEANKEIAKELLDYFSGNNLNSLLTNPDKTYLFYTGNIQIRGRL